MSYIRPEGDQTSAGIFDREIPHVLARTNIDSSENKAKDVENNSINNTKKKKSFFFLIRITIYRLELLYNLGREKYMPPTKTNIELFDEKCQIKTGKYFNELFGEEQDCQVCITGGKKNVQKAK